MIRACYHTHTVFCDGADSVETLCAAAYEKGFAALGFSAHAPCPYPSSWHLPAENLDAYLEAVRRAAADWKGKLEVYAGLEIDYIHGVCGPGDAKWKALGLDFAVGSVHYLVPGNGAAPFTVDGPREEWEGGVRDGYEGDPEAAARAYWRSVAAMVEADGFDFVGHLDLIKKNNKTGFGFPTFDPEGPGYREAAREALDAIEAADALVEVNTGGLNRGSLAECYPSPALLSDLGRRNTRVVVNADAHRKEHLDGHYGVAEEALRAAGYSRTWALLGGAWKDCPLE